MNGRTVFIADGGRCEGILGAGQQNEQRQWTRVRPCQTVALSETRSAQRVLEALDSRCDERRRQSTSSKISYNLEPACPTLLSVDRVRDRTSDYFQQPCHIYRRLLQTHEAFLDDSVALFR